MSSKRRGPGEGYIAQRRDAQGRPIPGQWRGEIMVGYRPDGRPDIRYVSGRSRREVQERLHALREQLRTGYLPPRESRTVAEHLRTWLRTVVEPARRPSTTLKRHQHIERHLVPALGHLLLSELTLEHVRACYAEMAKRGYARNSIASVHQTLRAALEDARQLGLVARNVADRATIPGRRQEEMRVLDAEQCRRLLAVLREQERQRVYAVAIELTLATGVRIGELLALRWSDTDLKETGTIRIARQLVGDPTGYSEPKTRRSRRSITLDPRTIATLRACARRQAEQRLLLGPDWEATDDDGDLMLTTPTGRPLSRTSLARHLHQALRRAGLPHLRWHDLRHTHATLALAAGINPRVLADRLGHASVVTTLQIYGHVLASMDAEAAKRVGDQIYDTGT